MDQKYDAAPLAELTLRGRRVTRSVVANDWGLQLRWLVTKDGKPAGTFPASRADTAYEHADAAPGKYEIVLQMWKYVDYRKGANGEFVTSAFIEISNKVSYTI